MRCTTMFLPVLLMGSSLTLAAADRWPHHDAPGHFSRSSVQHVNTTILNTTSMVEFTYDPLIGLDAPKVLPVNRTTWDWWYFDVVSDELASGDLSSLAVTFFIASPFGYEPLTNYTTTLASTIMGTFKNGTPIFINGYPDQATVRSEGDVSAGQWGDYGSWQASPDGKLWTLFYNDPSNGVSGSMTLERRAPPHLPCGPVETGGTEQLLPHVGWANIVPDAVGTVNFTVNGSALAFSGVGYHDKNWGDASFLSGIGNWYWGHGRLGPYTVVFFDAQSTSGGSYTSAYVAKDGKILSSSCVAGKSVVARPWGGDDTYPPGPTTGNPAGFEIVFAEVEGKEFRVNVTSVLNPINWPGYYARWLGLLDGGFTDGSGRWTGVMLDEQLNI